MVEKAQLLLGNAFSKNHEATFILRRRISRKFEGGFFCVPYLLEYILKLGDSGDDNNPQLLLTAFLFWKKYTPPSSYK